LNPISQKEIGISTSIFYQTAYNFSAGRTTRCSPICDKIPDSLQVLAIAGSKSRAVVEDKITIIFWNYLVIDIWSSWHYLISGMKLA